MKENIKINYKAIFQYDGVKDNMEFNEVGYYDTERNELSFFNQEQRYCIKIEKNTVYLQNGDARLVLVLDQVTKNQYQTPYGQMTINTKLKMVQEKPSIKLKYELLDEQGIIGTVYLLITTIKLENEYEII